MKQSLIEQLNEHVDKFNVILDSGAFTAFNTGRTIALDEYIAFIKDMPFKVEFYFTLDSIGNPIQTERNLDKLRADGFHPVPVFTRGQTKEDYLRYAKGGLVGIGGIAGTNDNFVYLRELYDKGILGPCDKVHWLGFWDRDFVLHYRPFSCDTQSWMSAARFARGWIYENRRLVSFDRNSYDSPAVVRYCARWGIDHRELRLDKNWRWDKRKAGLSQVIQALAAIEYVKMIRRKLGTTIYLACSGNQANQEVDILLNCLTNYMKGVDNGNEEDHS
jgi:hypothetical protein